MTTNELALPHPPAPARVGQATAIEQSRAAAEVHAAVLVAQQCPRNVPAAIREMEESCRIKALAERAFFRYNRGGSQVSGATVHLARELARCWGNIQYGVAELRRDDVAGESEMQAYAWDVQTNARSATIFIVPHKRDTTKDGPKPLTDMRDIYENNANMAARRVRECIFAVLPPWFTESAKDLCHKTLTEGGQVPLPQRRAEVLKNFAGLGVTENDIVRKLGKPVALWTAQDLAQLWVIGRSLQRGEVNRDDEFPPETLGKDDVLPGDPAAPTGAQERAEGTRDQVDADTTGHADTAQASAEAAQEPSPADAAPRDLVNAVKQRLAKAGCAQPAEQIHVLSMIVGRQLPTTTAMTTAEAQHAAEQLGRVTVQDNPAAALDQLLGELDANGGDQT